MYNYPQLRLHPTGNFSVKVFGKNTDERVENLIKIFISLF